MCHGAFLSACCSCISFPYNTTQSHIKWPPPPTENTFSVSTDSSSVFNRCLSLMTDAALASAGNESLSMKRSPSSQDSNSLSLLTEISGVEAPVPLRSVSVLQSLASGLPGWRGDAGNKWGWWWRSWREPSDERSEGRREESCCSLGGGRDERDEKGPTLESFLTVLFRQRHFPALLCLIMPHESC